MTTSTQIPNRLSIEKSPYLLQHAYNPVDWWSWCDEAFAKAKSEDKLVFVSIGYSTCHWCHVMERESFENDDVAEILNKYFISIKVDREERPDIDHIYMDVCQAITGQGGWPLSIFMDCNERPIYAGTYFPKDMLINILMKINEMWKNEKQSLINSAEDIVKFINKDKKTDKMQLTEDIVHKCFKNLALSFDDKFGGFNMAPKFPSPHNLYFLLRYYHIYKDENALNMVLKTLDSMYKGGIYDHVGFGFCRYSTDEKWIVPHFEKMLYDNALISIAYLEAYQITKREIYKKCASDIFTYVLRDMVSEDGGFYSAEDADSEGVEGKFYIWSKDEILKVLGREDGEKFCNKYDISEEGNFEGSNIPNLINNDLDMDKSIEASLEKLFHHRENRIHPFKDDKILTSWNGLMIAALSIGGRVLKDDKLTSAAIRAYEFISAKIVDDDDRLLVRYRDGKSAYLAYAEDYAYLIWGLIELYETTYDTIYLKKATILNNVFIDKFWDDENGGLYVYSNDSKKLLTRPKEIYDGATPSSNSAGLSNFVRLSELTQDFKLGSLAKQMLETFGRNISSNPMAFSNSLIGFMHLKHKRNLVLVSNDKDDLSKITDIVNDNFDPFLNISGYFKDSSLEEVNKDIVYYSIMDDKTTAFLCENNTCHEPINDAEKLMNMLYN